MYTTAANPTKLRNWFTLSSNLLKGVRLDRFLLIAVHSFESPLGYYPSHCFRNRDIHQRTPIKYSQFLSQWCSVPTVLLSQVHNAPSHIKALVYTVQPVCLSKEVIWCMYVCTFLRVRLQPVSDTVCVSTNR